MPKTIDNVDYSAIASFDVQNAYDVLSIPIFLRTLKALGARRATVKLFENYLDHRVTEVQVNGSSSKRKRQDEQLIQGSPCSSTVFLIAIRYIGCWIKEAKPESFADDVPIICSNNHFELFWDPKRCFYSLIPNVAHK